MLIHVHGVGRIDFSSMSPSDLDVIEEVARTNDVDLVPTIFLGRHFLVEFERVLKRYHAGGPEAYPHILGFAVEGPMLGTGGGVPPVGCWVPTGEEWRQIASFGDLGLKYMVIGPDALDLDDRVARGLTFRELIDCFYQQDVKLALGHFQHQDPVLSARRSSEVVDYIQSAYGPSPEILITDHLFNDMPRSFTHSWRTPDERRRREHEVAEFLTRPWRDDDLEEILGPVPAVLLREASNGRLVPVLNFDGEHVDLEICRRVVDYLGSWRMMAITDHTDSEIMAGERLSMRPGSNLRFRQDGVVAAGSSGLDVQRGNMTSIGLARQDIANLFMNVPRRVLSRRVCAAPS